MEDQPQNSEDYIDVEDAPLELLAYLKTKMASSGKTMIKANELATKYQQIKVRKPDGQGLQFADVLTLDTKVNTEVPNYEDDIQREVIFYNQTLEVVKRAFIELENNSIPWKRPDDYFAEMLKTDEHMEKIKKKLISEKKRMESVEEKKKQQQQKKYGKQIQKETENEKEKQKKREIEKVSKWRKARENGQEEFPMELDMDEPLDKKRKFKESIPVFAKRQNSGKNKDKSDRDSGDRGDKYRGKASKSGGGGGGGGDRGKMKAKRPGKMARQKGGPSKKR